MTSMEKLAQACDAERHTRRADTTVHACPMGAGEMHVTTLGYKYTISLLERRVFSANAP